MPPRKRKPTEGLGPCQMGCDADADYQICFGVHIRVCKACHHWMSQAIRKTHKEMQALRVKALATMNRFEIYDEIRARAKVAVKMGTRGPAPFRRPPIFEDEK